MLFPERRRFVQTMCEHHAYYTRLVMSVLRFSSLIPVCNMLFIVIVVGFQFYSVFCFYFPILYVDYVPKRKYCEILKDLVASNVNTCNRAP